MSKGLSAVFSNNIVQKPILPCSPFFIVQVSHPYMTTGKTIALTRWIFVSKVMPLLLKMLFRLVVNFLPRSKHLLIPWLQSPLAVTLDHTPPHNSLSLFCCFPIYFPWSDGTRCHDLSFLNVDFNPTFSPSSFTFIKKLFSSSSLSAIRVVSSAYLRLFIFLPTVIIPAWASSSQAFLMTYSEFKLDKQGDNIQPWLMPFLIWKQSVVPCPVLTVASWPVCRFLRRQVVLYSHLFRIFHSLLWSTHSKALCIQWSRDRMFFWNCLFFLMIQQMLVIWSLVPLAFLKPAWTSGSSRFTYCWNLTWRILNITLVVCEMSAINTL